MAEIGIGNAAFKNNTTITSVSFGSRCNYVGEDAFAGCTSLSNLTGTNMLTKIKEGAFRGCTSLTEIEFTKLGSIGNSAFNGCSSLTYIGIPNCKNIGKYAFKDCYNLTTVENIGINSIYTKINECAFENCTNLREINLNGCEIIGDYAFANCSNLGEINLNNCKIIGSNAFRNCTNLINITTTQCSVFYPAAFMNCNNLTQITLSNCYSIGDFAFFNCSNLRNVFINDSKCSRVGSYAFYKYVTESSEYSIIDNILFYFNMSDYSYYSQNPTWRYYTDRMISLPPNSRVIIYTTIDGKKLNISINGVTDGYGKYGYLAFDSDIAGVGNIFHGKTTLQTVVLPNGIMTIGQYAFSGCNELVDIVLPNSIEMLGHRAFENCIKLTYFNIPDSMKALQEGIFCGCKNIVFDGNKNFVKQHGNVLMSNNILIYISPKTFNESKIYSLSTINENIEKLGFACFSGHMNLKRLNIPSTIKEIGDDVLFYGCDNLCEIHFEGTEMPEMNLKSNSNSNDSLKIFVPEKSFNIYSDALSEYTVYPTPESNSIIYFSNEPLNNSHKEVKTSRGNYYIISNVGDTVNANYFKNNTSITKVILGEGITTIKEYAFKNCKNLDYIYLPEGIKEFGKQCFYRCESLEKIHIPSSLTTFGDEIFYGCVNLKEFDSYNEGCISDDNRCYIHSYSSNNENIKELKFFAQGGLSEYTIPNDITQISKYAFEGSNIEKITLNSNITFIDDYTFADCENLTTISNYDEITRINAFAFSGCKNLTTCIINQKTEIVEEGAFKNCAKIVFTDDNPLELNITQINKSTFAGCVGIQSVLMNDETYTIDDNAFNGCTSLKSINITSLKNLTTIGYSAFYECSSLWGDATEITLPNSIVNIGHNAFSGCCTSQLETLTLPTSLKSLGDGCFTYDKSTRSIFKNIYIPDELTEPPVLSPRNDTLLVGQPFGNVSTQNNLTIHVPNEIYNTYKHDKYWGFYSNKIIEKNSGEEKNIEDYFISIVTNVLRYTQIKVSKPLPANWVGAKVYFDFYDKNEKILSSKYTSFTINSELCNTASTTDYVVITNTPSDAKYIKINNVNNTSIKFDGSLQSITNNSGITGIPSIENNLAGNTF